MKKYLQGLTLWLVYIIAIPVTVSGAQQQEEKVRAPFFIPVSTCHSISEIEPYIHDLTVNDLVVLDFDDTLFSQAIKAVGPMAIKPVEEDLDGGNGPTMSFLRKVRASGCPIIILTARSILGETFQQIKNIDFNFAENTPRCELSFILKSCFDKIDYKDGFIFCGNNNKGLALVAFFALIGRFPNSVYFVDDRIENVVNVYHACSCCQIPFKGFHYVYIHENPELVNTCRFL